jgi:cell division protein FtsB
VEKVIPELVFTNEVDGYKGINYAEVTAVLVEAIKELKAENKQLKDENKEIKAENLELKANDKAFNSRLERLEQLMGAAAENKK